jgi:Flp pilus assembly protein TadD
MEHGENPRAIELFRKAVTVKARHHQSWGNLGACLLQIGELDEGEQALRRGLDRVTVLQCPERAGALDGSG